MGLDSGTVVLIGPEPLMGEHNAKHWDEGSPEPQVGVPVQGLHIHE